MQYFHGGIVAFPYVLLLEGNNTKSYISQSEAELLFRPHAHMWNTYVVAYLSPGIVQSVHWLSGVIENMVHSPVSLTW